MPVTLATIGAGSVSSDSVRVVAETIHAISDLGCTAFNASGGQSSSTATANAAALQGAFDNWNAEGERTLVLPPKGIGFNTKLTLPHYSGGQIVCLGGGTDVRSEAEYTGTGSTSFGGNASRLIWTGDVGSGSGAMVEYQGYGLNIVGTLVLQGIWDASDRTNITGATVATDGPEIGLFIQGNVGSTSPPVGTAAGLGNGKLRVDGLTVIGAQVGLQFGEEELQDNADNSYFEYYQSLFCGTALKVINRQSVNLIFGYLRPYLTPIAIDLDNGGHVNIQHSELIYTTGNNTWLITRGLQQNTSHVKCSYLQIDAQSAGWRLVDQQEIGPLHVEIGGHNSSATASRDIAVLKDNACLVLDKFYNVPEGKIATSSQNYADFGGEVLEVAPTVVMHGCRMLNNEYPWNVLNESSSTRSATIRWTDCYEHSGERFPNGFRTLSSGSYTLPSFYGEVQTAAVAPSTTHFAVDGQWGLHKNTADERVTIAFNDGGTVRAIAPQLIFSATGNATANAATAETLIGNLSGQPYLIPANTLRVGDVLRIRLHGYYTTTAANEQLTILLGMTAATLRTFTTTALPGSQTNAFWRAEVDIVVRAAGASGSLMASGFWEFEDTGGLVHVEKMAGGSGVSVDTTANLTYVLTGTWSDATAPPNITAHTHTMELIPAAV